LPVGTNEKGEDSSPGADVHATGGIPDSVKYPRAVRYQLIGYLEGLASDFHGIGDSARGFAAILAEVEGDRGDDGVDLQIGRLKRELDHLWESIGHIRSTL
jgi:hypothetical protein